MKQWRILTSAGFSTVIILFAFQNCGQPGQLGSSQDSTSGISNSLVIGAPVSSAPSSTATEPNAADLPATPNVTADPQVGFNDTVQTGVCANLQPSDALLNIDSIADSAGQPALEIKAIDHTISISQPTLLVQAVASSSVSEINLVLAPTGNYLMTLDQQVYGLTTPSAQTSGFKIQLASPVSLEMGKEYQLAITIDLSRQIVVNGQKCLLKPIVRDGTLTAI
jgi:hypothetical protein